MAKYKIVGEPEVRNGEFGEYKIASLEGPAGEIYHNVFFGSRGTGYNRVVPTGEVEGEIDANGKGKKFVFPRSSTWGAKAKDPAEEAKRSKRIAFLASTERALEVVSFMEDKPKTAESMKKAITGWRDWFVSEVENYESKLK